MREHPMITVPIVFTPIIIIEMSLGTGKTAQWLRAAFSEHLGLIPSAHMMVYINW